MTSAVFLYLLGTAIVIVGAYVAVKTAPIVGASVVASGVALIQTAVFLDVYGADRERWSVVRFRPGWFTLARREPPRGGDEEAILDTANRATKRPAA